MVKLGESSSMIAMVSSCFLIFFYSCFECGLINASQSMIISLIYLDLLFWKKVDKKSKLNGIKICIIIQCYSNFWIYLVLIEYSNIIQVSVSNIWMLKYTLVHSASVFVNANTVISFAVMFCMSAARAKSINLDHLAYIRP